MIQLGSVRLSGDSTGIHWSQLRLMGLSRDQWRLVESHWGVIRAQWESVGVIGAQ